MLSVGVKREYLLYDGPGGEVYDWVAVVFYCEVSEAEDADVDFVFKEGAV